MKNSKVKALNTLENGQVGIKVGMPISQGAKRPCLPRCSSLPACEYRGFHGTVRHPSGTELPSVQKNTRNHPVTRQSPEDERIVAGVFLYLME